MPESPRPPTPGGRTTNRTRTTPSTSVGARRSPGPAGARRARRTRRRARSRWRGRARRGRESTGSPVEAEVVVCPRIAAEPEGEDHHDAEHEEERRRTRAPARRRARRRSGSRSSRGPFRAGGVGRRRAVIRPSPVEKRWPRADPVGADPVDGPDQRRGGDESDDQRLDDHDDVDRRRRSPPACPSPRPAARRTAGGADHADRVGPAEQGEGDGVEADRWKSRRSGCTTGTPRMFDVPARPASPPASRHRQDVGGADAHAGVAGGVRVGADRPQPEPDRRCGTAATTRRRPRASARRSPQWSRQARPRVGESAPTRRRLRDRVVAARAQERLGAEEVVEQPQRDEVEHDRRDHLVGPGAGLEHAGDAAPDRAGDERRR